MAVFSDLSVYFNNALSLVGDVLGFIFSEGRELLILIFLFPLLLLLIGYVKRLVS